MSKMTSRQAYFCSKNGCQQNSAGRKAPFGTGLDCSHWHQLQQHGCQQNSAGRNAPFGTGLDRSQQHCHSKSSHSQQLHRRRFHRRRQQLHRFQMYTKLDTKLALILCYLLPALGQSLHPRQQVKYPHCCRWNWAQPSLQIRTYRGLWQTRKASHRDTVHHIVDLAEVIQQWCPPPASCARGPLRRRGLVLPRTEVQWAGKTQPPAGERMSHVIRRSLVSSSLSSSSSSGSTWASGSSGSSGSGGGHERRGKG